MAAKTDQIVQLVPPGGRAGALGLRVQEESQIPSAIEQALANTQGPTIIEFVIACDELVFPMVPGGNALNDMILDY